MSRKMKSTAAIHEPKRPGCRRRARYVDRAIQRPLLLAVTALEVVLVMASVWFIHWRLTHYIDDSMYRMHALEAALSLNRLALEVLPVLALFGAFNLLVLTLIAALWSAYENRALQRLMSLMAKTTELDFSADPVEHRQLQVLSLVAIWRARDRARFAAIRNQLEQVETVVLSGKSDTDTLITLTKAMHSLLP